MRVFKDADDNRVTFDDLGVTYMSDEKIAELGLTEVEEDYQKPETKAQKVSAINAEYAVTYAKIIENIGKATAMNNSTAVASWQAKYKEAMAAHKLAKDVINNG